MLLEVYDIETLSNLFTYTGYSIEEKKYYQFVIHQSRNDYEELLIHLRRGKLLMIGYNNDAFDYPVIHHMLNHENEYKQLSGADLASRIYKKSQDIIDQDFSAIADYNKHIKQLDLFKIWHFDNKAKYTRLKDLEVALKLPLVEDMPIEHFEFVFEKDIPKVLSYNKNDVYATTKFFLTTLGKTNNVSYKGKNKIEIRQRVRKQYGLNCLNYNDIKLGTELILKLYCDKTGRNIKEVRKLRTFRPEINLGDCLPTWMEFKSKEFQKLVNKFKNTTIYNGITKDVFSTSVIYNGIKIDYGTGGAHASIKSGVYSSDDEYIILDLDIDGMYPNLALTQGIYPEHLGPEFLDIYGNDIVYVRMAEKKKPKKERDFVIMEGFKLAANGSYGKSNSSDSFLYDPLYTMKTTVSGQILISMWMERVCSKIRAQIIQVNTDGWTMKIKRSDVDEVLKISDQLMVDTGLTYESNTYKKMVIRDVNNYSAQYEYGEIKHKGAFEINKELHKDPSMRIVPLALESYFFKGIPLKDTIQNHKDIYDYCLRIKTNRNSDPFFDYLEDGDLKTIKMDKTSRYFISNKGGAIYTIGSGDSKREGKKNGVNVGYNTTLFNRYEQRDDYNINYNFYIAESKKIVNLIEGSSLDLFSHSDF